MGKSLRNIFSATLWSRIELNEWNFNLKKHISIVMNSFFLYHRSSIVVKKIYSRINENVDLYSEIPCFGEKLDAENGINWIKPKAKIPFQLEELPKKVHPKIKNLNNKNIVSYIKKKKSVFVVIH